MTCFKTAVLQRRIFNGAAPNVYDYGYFMKSACDLAAEPYEPTELYEYCAPAKAARCIWLKSAT
jgi:hypothetical protein